MKNEILTFSPADNELLLSEMEMLEVYGGTGDEGGPNTNCGNAKCKCIIRKTKRFAIPERAVYFLKTKRTAGSTPPPQNIFDRLTPVFT